MGGRTIDSLIATIQAQLFNPFIRLLKIAAALLFLYGVVEFIAGASNEDKRIQGKRHMIWGLVGLLIMFAVDYIIQILQNFFR